MFESSQAVRANLVIVRAGDTSLHPEWLRNIPGRQWDLVVSYFGDDKSIFVESDVKRIDSKGPKMPTLYATIRQHLDEISRYEYVWFPDDDLECDGAAINEFFVYCKRFNLALAQPSLTADSFVTHPITVHNPHYLLRFTNFVEMMAPCFHRRALEMCAPTFNENLSGWGMDHLWPHLLRPSSSRIAVVDAVSIKHTRPVGGPNYRFVRAEGRSAAQELRELLTQHGIQREFLETVGAVDLTGHHLSEEQFALEIDHWLTAPW